MDYDFISSYKSNDKTRIHAIDLLKIIAAIFVVFIHSSEILEKGLSSPFGNLLWITSIPLFFFCSGFVSTTNISNGKELFKKIGKSACVLLIPCVTFMIIKTISGEFDGNILKAFVAFINNPETNLWFLWALFIINSTFFIGIYLFTSVKSKFKFLTPYIFPFLIIFTFFLITFLTRNGKVLSIQYIAFYYPFYCFGFFLKIFINSINDCLNKKALIISNCLLVTSIIGVLIFAFAFKSIQSFSDYHLGYVLLRYIGSVFSCLMFFGICGYLSKNVFFQNFSKFGKYTLEIYYLHILVWKTVIQISFSNFEIVNFVFCSFILIMISAGLIIAMYFLPFVHLVLFGRKFSLFDTKIINFCKFKFFKKDNETKESQ